MSIDCKGYPCPAQLQQFPAAYQRHIDIDVKLRVSMSSSPNFSYWSKSEFVQAGYKHSVANSKTEAVGKELKLWDLGEGLMTTPRPA